MQAIEFKIKILKSFGVRTTQKIILGSLFLN